ncbi:serine/threonine-protein kinase [Frigoribacterium sp. CG_9.8]|uniref:serine/threonine-protein kinase n=1 Tax=Frigoribacterium sp. CG_9.8 TaxID=2787733 RepID=UPI0018C9AC01|nr:serine/threonine-protein kinase [Frigoribacterium sp. CG_9.8]MBG6107692.1 serine/threonine protein kinase [Frigoribacterium sp. CG_9.8]
MTNDPNRSPSSALAAGDLIGDRFRIESTVGAGGMATVYRARDEALGRTVALKVFRWELADADDVRRQRDEVQLLASLNAPGLVTLFDAVAEGGVGDHGRAYLVLEFVDGVDLRTRLLEGLPDQESVGRIGSDVASALAYIHTRGVVHRDVKPGNILLPHDHSTPGAPLAKLADFGIARLLDDARMTATGTVIGTATYLSPEQAEGATVGTASDVYSLGLVLLESLTGQRAFPGTAIESVLARLARDPEIPHSLAGPWRNVLTAMTQRVPADRPDASSVAATLRDPSFRALASLGPSASGPDTEATQLMDTELPATAVFGTEHEEPTKLLPAAENLAPALARPAPETTAATTAATAAATTAATTVFAAPAAEAGPEAASGRPVRRRFAILGSSVLAAIIVVVLAMSLSRAMLTGPEASTSPQPAPASTSSVSYPAVSGTLGRHLSQLQQSVAP